MSALRLPPRALLPILAVVLCLVSATSLFSQTIAEPDPSSESVVISSENAASVVIENTETTVENVTDNKSDSGKSVVDAVNSAIDNVAKEAEAIAAEAKEAVAETTEAVTENVETVTEEVKDTAVETTEVVTEGVEAVTEEVKDTVVETTEAVNEIVENKAIPPEVSPKDEVVNPVSSEPDVVLPETIPSANAENITAEKADTETTPMVASENNAKAEEPKAAKKAQELYYFESSRGTTLAVIIVLLVFVSYYTFQAQRGKEMFIRRISGLSAIEDAVGRATEMGRGVLYVPGIADMDDIQTIAGVTILGHVARKTAEYDTDLYAPMCRSFVMSVAQEVVKQAYLEKGRVDAYRADRINYLTDDQFGYVAGVGGVMMRDKPAACFYLGTFYAESLILAETGNSVGAIQIAGTAEPSQIPFFVAACDYTLIGEELFAASAYLSKNPREIGSLKGQDMVKVCIILAIIVGTILVTISATKYGQNTFFATMATEYMNYLK